MKNMQKGLRIGDTPHPSLLPKATRMSNGHPPGEGTV